MGFERFVPRKERSLDLVDVVRVVVLGLVGEVLPEVVWRACRDEAREVEGGAEGRGLLRRLTGECFCSHCLIGDSCSIVGDVVVAWAAECGVFTALCELGNRGGSTLHFVSDRRVRKRRMTEGCVDSSSRVKCRQQSWCFMYQRSPCVYNVGRP